MPTHLLLVVNYEEGYGRGREACVHVSAVTRSATEDRASTATTAKSGINLSPEGLMSQKSKRTPAHHTAAKATGTYAWQTEAFLRFVTALAFVVGIYALASVFGV